MVAKMPDNAADYAKGSSLVSKSGKRCPVDDYELDMDWETDILNCPWCKRRFEKDLTELVMKEGA